MVVVLVLVLLCCLDDIIFMVCFANENAYSMKLVLVGSTVHVIVRYVSVSVHV